MESGPPSMAGHFGVVDATVFGLMLACSIGIGIYSSVRGAASSTQEFLLGGRNMSPIPVAISLLGGIISAISILGNATEVYYFGTQLSISLLGSIVGTIFVNQVTLPVFYNLKITSLNEYIELRFKSAALRKLMTCGALVTAAIYMGMCLYAPSLALSTVTSLSTFGSMAIMGAICTFYITIGGVKAVVYTDVLQTMLMFVGVLIVVILCCVDLGGVSYVWQYAMEGQRTQFFNMNPDVHVRHTFFSTFTFGVFLIINVIGTNQSTYQRFASVATFSTAKRLCWFFLLGLWVLWVLFYFSGLVAYAVYRDCDPLEAGYITKADQIMPFLVTDKLSYLPGLPGVFVAAVYGGVLSSLSSSGNSAACLVWEDFLKPIPFFSKLSDKSATNVIKFLSSLTGIIAVCLGLLMGNLGNVFHVINLIVSCIAGPSAGMFLTGILVPWANAKSTGIGFLVAFTIILVLVIGKFRKGGGSPQMLPLSVAGCSFNSTYNLLNTTMIPNATMIQGVTTILHNATTILQNATMIQSATTMLSSDAMLFNDTIPDYNPNVQMSESEEEHGFFDISYCFLGMFGCLMTLAVSAILSVFTGPMTPKEVPEELVYPWSARGYRWVWRKLKKGSMEGAVRPWESSGAGGGKGGKGETTEYPMQAMAMLNHDSSLHTPSP